MIKPDPKAVKAEMERQWSERPLKFAYNKAAWDIYPSVDGKGMHVVAIPGKPIKAKPTKKVKWPRK